MKELAENLDKMKAAVLADFTHLTVAEMQDLRKKLREQGAVLKVAKKSLFKIALEKNKNLKKIKDSLQVAGPLSLAFGLVDEIAPAKTLVDFKREHQKLEILGGILGGNYLSQAEVLNLAKLPSKEEMQAKLVSLFAAPLAGLANVCVANLRNLIYILKNISRGNS